VLLLPCPQTHHRIPNRFPLAPEDFARWYTIVLYLHLLTQKIWVLVPGCSIQSNPNTTLPNTDNCVLFAMYSFQYHLQSLGTLSCPFQNRCNRNNRSSCLVQLLCMQSTNYFPRSTPSPFLNRQFERNHC